MVILMYRIMANLIVYTACRVVHFSVARIQLLGIFFSSDPDITFIDGYMILFYLEQNIEIRISFDVTF